MLAVSVLALSCEHLGEAFALQPREAAPLATAA